MHNKIEIYRVIIPIHCNQKSKMFYEEARRIFFNKTKGNIHLEVSSPCDAHHVEVVYRSPIDGEDPLISAEVETSKIFLDLNQFKDFLDAVAT